MMRVLILDDEPSARQTLLSYVTKNIPEVETKEASSIDSAFEALHNFQPDLALLDINLAEGVTSFDFLAHLTPEQLTFKIIFVSAHNEYAIKAFKFNAIDYILKPINPFEFKAAIDKVLKENHPTEETQIKSLSDSLKIKNQQLRRIVLKDQNSIQIVDIDEIYYCKSDSNYTIFALQQGKEAVVSRTLKDYESILREVGFYRPHRSYLINMNYLRKYDKREGGTIEMVDGTFIPLARAKKESFLAALNSIS
ncbi:LytR/AlgR family response regulator transcription factor [Reichenbachiella agariperforans]|uniref:LytR/AlgR family response regulator transcription factor n=1 Tax=Reichenbachiella agariperforans TaxID=156994 RepID=UPI001C091750|nr:LytTR family DNA-binding domain-containing protein [Reichenbachiella agariperforans]MBU2914467.1 LytTR family DNA-binding domain-containing protein [Reichenbachiella agariperforans]